MDTVPTAEISVVARAVLDGIAQGLREETPPSLTSAQRERLATIAQDALRVLEESFGRLAPPAGISRRRSRLPDAEKGK